VCRGQRFEYLVARVTTEIAFVSVGTALLACALVANQRFLDRHFVPSFFLPRHWYVVLETFGRLAMATLGALFVFVARPRAARFAARTPARALHIVIAVVLALGTSELVLRHVHLRPTEWLSPDDEPRRHPIHDWAGPGRRRVPGGRPSAGASSTTPSTRPDIASNLSMHLSIPSSRRFCSPESR
jgi:hypothetical protein